MRRALWPVGLRPLRVTPMGGPRSLGMTESVTAEVQTVSQPYGLLKYQFDFPALSGRMAAEFTGMLAALEDGANWVAAPCIYAHSPSARSLGYSPPQSGSPWSNEMPWSNGQNWNNGRPMAVAASAAAAGARSITIDVSAWNGIMWNGAPIGFAPFYFGAHYPQEVRIVDNIATVRFTPGLRRAVAAGEYVTLSPVIAGRLQPGSWQGGQRVGRFQEGASITLIEVPDDIVRAYTE